MSNVLFHDLLVEAQTSWLQLANTYQEEGYVYEPFFSWDFGFSMEKDYWFFQWKTLQEDFIQSNFLGGKGLFFISQELCWWYEEVFLKSLWWAVFQTSGHYLF